MTLTGPATWHWLVTLPCDTDWPCHVTSKILFQIPVTKMETPRLSQAFFHHQSTIFLLPTPTFSHYVRDQSTPPNRNEQDANILKHNPWLQQVAITNGICSRAFRVNNLLDKIDLCKLWQIIVDPTDWKSTHNPITYRWQDHNRVIIYCNFGLGFGNSWTIELKFCVLFWFLSNVSP